MNKLVIAIAITAICGITMAAKDPFKGLTPAQKEAKKEECRRRMYERTGGFLLQDEKTGKRFAFLDMQGNVKHEKISEPITTLERILRRKVTLEKFDEKFAIDQVPQLMKKADVAGAIFMVDEPSLPTVLVAPESGWGVINVNALKADKPAELLLNQRVSREMWRVFAMVNGASNSMMGKCLMQTVTDLKSLDALDAQAFCPEPMNKIMMHLDHTGVQKIRRITYRGACLEGWAPMPTNAVQRAIWEGVRNGTIKPTKRP